MATPVKSNQQHIFIHDAICEGPVEGLLYGESSVYLNNNRARPLNPDSPYTPLNGKITFTSTTDTTGSLSSNIPADYVGTPNNTNYLIIRGGSIEKSGTPSNNNGVFTITGNANFTAEYTTEDNLNKSIALVSTDESEQVYLIGEGVLDGTDLKFTPRQEHYTNASIVQAIDYKVQLVESLEISSISINSITVANGPSLGNNTYNYFISGSLQPDAEDVEAENPSVQKVKVQFRNGSAIQDPIVELNGMGGGSSYTGNPQSATPNQLKQLSIAAWNAQQGDPANKIPRSDTPAGDPYPGYGKGFYPEGETITTEGAIAPTIISATDFGVSAGQIPLLDEVRVSISYNSLYAVSKKDGGETTNTAVYLFQIRKKAPGAASFNEWRHAFRNAEGTSVGQIFHTAQNKSAISFEHFIDLDFIKPFEDFEIRITRLTRHKGRSCLSQGQDSGNDQELEGGDFTGFISNLTAINRDKFYYPYTAHAGIFLDSREYNSLPKRSYEMRGMRVRVPNGYLPREYSSTGDAIYPDFWDGTLSNSFYYTNNPAWVFYDIIVNDRFGAGEWIKEDDVDLYALYRISKYCDELVDDGKGGTEPRFTANLYLSKATDVYKVLKDMATIFTSLIYWMDGKMTTILDAPGDPVYNFSRANVIDGAFSYETTGQKTKTNQVVVTWNDPALNYEQSTLVIEDRASIVREGRIIKEDAFAFGCTSEGQAQRYGKWKLFTAQGQTEVISFKTALEGAFIRPGDIIQVQDTARYGAKFSGRITSATSSAVTLDRPVTLNSTASYELAVIITEPAAFYVGDGTINIRNAADTANEETYTRGQRITRAWVDDNTNGTRTLQTVDTEAKASNAWTKETGGESLPTTWSEDSYVETASISNDQSNVTTLTASFNVTPRSNSIWVITETESGAPTVGSADLYKVLGISQDDKNIYSISAVEHTNDKYAYVDDPDSILDIPNDVFPTEPEVAIAPTQVRILQTSDASRPDEELQVQWDYPTLVDVGSGELQETTRYLDGFEIVHNVPGLESPVNVGKRRRNYGFSNVPDGSYVFRVQSISVSGKRSEWATARYLVDNPFGDEVNRIKGLQTEGLTNNFPYITNHIGTNRGVYDTSGSVTYSANDIVRDGTNGSFYFLAGSDSNVGHVSVSNDNSNSPGTWRAYEHGVLKFTDEIYNPVLAPSRFRSEETVSLTSGYTLDCTPMSTLGTAFPGAPGANPRSAYVVLDHGSSALKLIKADFDTPLNLFYWQDLSVYDPANTDAVWTSIGSVTVAAGSNKVVGNGTTFTSLNNLNKLKFSTTGSNISFSGISWSGGIATVSATAHGLNAGDIISISGANPEGYNSYTVTISTVTTNSFTYSIGTNPGTYTSGGTITPYTFYEGARVAYIESDTVLYLNRKLDEDTAFSGTAKVQNYAPDFRRDVIIGQVFYNTTTEAYKFVNFLTLDPSLKEGRSVFLDTNTAFIQFDLNDEPVLLPEEIIVDATATGYEQPLFKVTYTNGDTVFEAEDTGYTAPSGNNSFKYEKTIYTYDESSLPTYSATPYEIQVDVIEGKDPGNSDKYSSDTLSIPMVNEVAVASGAQIVSLELEDYSIIYNEGGTSPAFNNSLNDTDKITITGTASPKGFVDPIFKFTVDGTVIQVGGYDWFDPGAVNTASVQWPVPQNIGEGTSGSPFTWDGADGGSKIVKVEAAEKPTNWTDGSSTPPDADDIVQDVDNIQAFRIGRGGVGVVVTNDSAIVSCNADGSTKSGASAASGTGTNIEVYSGGIGFNYVANNPSYGEWTFGNLTPSDSNITVGARSVGGSGTPTDPYYAIVADHVFNGTVGSTLDVAENIEYEIQIPGGQGQAQINTRRFQTFGLAVDGQDAANSSSIVFLYAAAPKGSTPTAINQDSNFPDVVVDLTTGLIDTSATGKYDGDEQSPQNTGTRWFTSANAALTNAANTTDIVYACSASANGQPGDLEDEISYNEWTNPYKFTGADGLNQAVVDIYLGTDSLSAPDLPNVDVTYTFATASIPNGTVGNGNTGETWSQANIAPSRNEPYVWRSSASAVSIETTFNIDGTDGGVSAWSTPQLVNRFVEDGITFELDNDVETVGIDDFANPSSGLNILTRAKLFRAGVDITSEWTISVQGTATGITGSLGTGGDSNLYTCTALAANYESGNVTLRATPDANGDYAGAATRDTNFTITRILGEPGVSYRIIPSPSVISYNPDTDTYTGGTGNDSNTVTFNAIKVTPGSSTAQSGYWAQTGGVNDSINNTAAANSITVEADASNDIQVSFYLTNNSGTLEDLVDQEGVPVVSTGLASKALALSTDAQNFVLREDGTFSPSSIQFTAVKQNITGNVSWSSSATLYSDAGLQSAITQGTFTGDSVYLSSASVASVDSVSVSANCTFNSVTYTDSETVEKLIDGGSAINVSLSNDNFTAPADNDGTNPDMTGSGTSLSVFEGATYLTYNSTATTNQSLSDGEWRISGGPSSAAGIVAATPSVSNNKTLVYGVAGAGSGSFSGSGNTGTIVWTIAAKTQRGDIVTGVQTVQTFSKAKGGTDGVSLTSTQEYYKLTNSATAPSRYSSGTTIDTGWTTTPPQPTSSNKYLWNFNRNTKSNGTTEDTNVILLSTLVKSIASITEAYQVHSSPTAANTTGTWYSTIAAAVAAQEINSTYPYLWNKTTIAYTDGSTSTVVYSLIAVRGNDGVSFSGTVEYYKIHSSKTNAPARYSSGTTIDSGWNTTPATPTTTNRYTWNFNRSTKSDSTFTDSQPVLVSELVKSISSITEEYQKGSSATTAPTGTWYSTIAGAGSIDATNPYMWNKTTIAYTDGSASTVTTTVIAARGSDGVSYTGTAEYYKLTNSSTAPGRYSSGTTIDTGWSTSPSTPTSTNQYLWNFNRNSKSDGSFQDSAVYLVTQFVQDGRGIASISEAYQRGTSPTSAPTGTWTTFANAGTLTALIPYMWNRTTIAYTDGSANTVIYTVIAARGTDGYTPIKGTDYDDGEDGDPGVDGVAVSVNPSVASVTYFYDGANWDPSVTSATVKVLTTGLSSVSYSWGSSSGTGTGATRTISFSSNVAEGNISGQSASGSVTVSGTKSDGTSYSSGALSWAIPAAKAARGAQGDQGGPGFFKITRSGSGTATGSAGSQLGPPSTSEVSEPTTNSAAIVQNNSGQKAYVYSGTAWTLTTLIDTGVIAASAITATLIDANAVTADKIFAGAVTAAKIDADAVTAEKLQISNSTGSSDAGINMNYNSGNPKIEISDGTNIRVVLGYLS